MNKEVVSPRPPERVNFPIDVQFHAACKNADLDEVKTLLAKGLDINVTNVDGLTVLHQACIDENYDVVQFLLENNANVNAQDNEGWTPLHACASCAYPELAKLLLEHGADTGIVSFEQELPLDVAQGKDMVALLKDWMQRQSVDENAARSAEERQMLQDAQEWLRTGKYPQVVDPRTGATALHIAAAKGYSDVLELLLKLPNVDVDATDVDGWTPLHAAAHWAKEKPLRLLAAAGASFDVITLTNQSIYDVAERSVTMLLRQLRNEQQRSAAAAAAEEKPVVNPPAVATRRRAEDEDEKKPEPSGISRAPPNEEEEEAKVAAPKVAKIEEPAGRTTPTKEEQAEEAEEEAKKASDLLNKAQKDEVALKAKKHEEKQREVSKKQAEKPSSPPPPPLKAEKVEKQAPRDEIILKEASAAADSKKPSSTSPTTIPQTPKTPSVAQPSTQNNQANTEAAVNVDTASTPSRSSRRVGKKDSTAIKRISAVLAPARSEETEAQRSSKARLVRSTRRSTQGIANDVLEEARRLSTSGTTAAAPNATTTTAAAAAVTPTPVQPHDQTINSPLASSFIVSTSSLQPVQPSASKNHPRQKSFASKITLGHLAQPLILSRPRRNALIGKVNRPGRNGATYIPSPLEQQVTSADATETTRKQPVDEAMPAAAASLQTTHVSKATITPTQPSATSSTAPSADTTPSSIVAHSRARRATRDRVPTGKLNTSDVLAAAKQVEQGAAASTSDDSTIPATSTLPSDPIPRPTTRVLRSTILNSTPTTTNSDGSSNEPVLSNGSGDRSDSPAGPQFSTSSPSSSSTPLVGKPTDQRYNWREDPSENEVTTTKPLENLDYRLLYEEERSEKERLKRTLDQVNHEMNALRSELAKLHLSGSNTRTSGGSGDSSLPQRNAMEYYENQAKEIDRLRTENARMADENKSLIRVIKSNQGKDVAIAWLSMICMLVYVPMIIPATWLLNHYGLRVSILFGAGLNALGAWIKCISMEFSQPYNAASTSATFSFPLLMTGQFVCALGQVFLLGVPAQLAGTWFGKSELALATAIGVFGNQVGCALGFGLPPLMVPAVTDTTEIDQFETIRRGFRIMLYGGAAIITIDLIAVAIFFKEEPEIAPTRARYKRILQRRGQLPNAKLNDGNFDSNIEKAASIIAMGKSNPLQKSYFKQVCYCFKSASFVLLNICYGVNTGVYYEIGTLLNTIVSEFFPTEQVAIGWIGFAMVIAGVVGSIMAGIVLKKTGLYRLVVIIFYMLSVVSWGTFMGSVYSPHIAAVFLAMILLGFFQSGLLPLGFEYAAEITYPIDEGLTSGILNTSAHIFGIILTHVATAMHEEYGSLPTNLFILACMLVAAIPACFMKDDLKRQQVQQMVEIEVSIASAEQFETFNGINVENQTH
ncbi:hypothetical protein Aperf_G00000122740 [Anoplocephala perfoliata]